MTNLGFIVEGDDDAMVIRALVERMTPRGTKLALVRAGGKIGILSASPTVAILQEQGYEHVFILFDSDTSNPDSIHEQEARLIDMLATRGLNHGVSVCPVVTSLDAWLLGGMPEQPADVVDPNQAFARLRDSGHVPRDLRRVAQKLDLDLLRSRNPSFAAFAQQIEHVCATAGTH